MATKFFEAPSRFESSIIDANPVSLREVSGFNDGVATVYFQLFDTTVLPTTGVTLPNHQARVPPGATFRGDFRQMNRNFPVGLVCAFSTTPDVFTAGAGAIGYVEAVYEG